MGSWLILTQFIIEAVVLSVAGGVVGLGVGLGVSAVAALGVGFALGRLLPGGLLC